ncbi:unnamed protein product [Lepidochelys kempii]
MAEPPSTLAVRRRSRRMRKKRNFSPEVEIVVKGRNVSRGDCAAGQGRQDSGTGRGFCCDLCSSPYIVDPGRRGNQLKTSSSLPSPRHKRDPRTGQVLTLCKAWEPRSTPNPVKDPGLDERKRHEEQLQAFGRSMVGDQDGSKLCCPAYTRKPCLCLQNYLKAPGGEPSGLGSGQRRSLAFEDFVLKNQRVLREELKLCERVTQRILGYSNNFLHKKLQTSSQMAHTYGRLLQHWRDRALMGQSEAHRVLAEMLTPSGGCRCNCYHFRSWVTGSSPSTVSKVNEQMMRLGGDREPPPHKLKQWRKENPKPNKKGSDAGERVQPSQAPSLASPSTAGSQELPSASVHGPASAGEPPTSGTGALDPCPPPQAMLVSSIVSAPPGTGGEISPCTRRPADTFSPLTLSSPLPHRARLSSSIHRDLATRGIRPTLRSLHPRPSLLLALSFLVQTPGCVHPISRCREQRNYGKAKSCSLL